MNDAPTKPAALVGRIPIVDTAATFGIQLEPDADGQGVGFRFGFLTQDGSLLPCHSTGAGQSPLAFIALLRQAVDSLDDQAKAAGW